MAVALEQSEDSLANIWNDRFRGDFDVPVVVQLGRSKITTRALGAAFMINGRAFLSVWHVAGAVPLRDVTPFYSVQVRIKRRDCDGFWFPTHWNDRHELQLAIDQLCIDDPTVVSVETSRAPTP